MFKRSKFITGIVMGALFGLAFAPKKGKELRDEIKGDLKKGGNAKDILKKNATQMSHDIASTAKEIYETPEVQKHLDKGKKEASKILHAVKDEISKKGGEFGEMAKEKLMETKNKLVEDLGAKEQEVEKKLKKTFKKSTKKK